jgi:hypothetical protein
MDSGSGIEYIFYTTGWKDSNGIWGYIHSPGTITVQTARVGVREQATKHNEQVVITP